MDKMTVEQLCDQLYTTGYEDRRKERDYDPRGSEAWQHCYDALSKRVPDGWKLVPVEPSDQMLRNAWDECSVGSEGDCRTCYRAMLAAAPAQPADSDGTFSYHSGHNSERLIIAEKDAEIAMLRERVKELEGAIDGFLAIVSDSTGVYGYHLNGDLAPWDYFEEVEIAARLRDGGDV